MTNLSERILNTRKQGRLRQKDIASSIGVSVQTVGRWEKGERCPNAEEIQKLARALDTSVAYLLGETDNNTGAISGNINNISGSGSINNISGSGNIVGSSKGRITTKTEHLQTLSDCSDEEVTTEKSDIPERGIIVEYNEEYHEGYHQGTNASDKKTDKKIKLTFPPGTSPEEMEAVVSKIVRATLGSDPREKPPENPLTPGAGADI